MSGISSPQQAYQTELTANDATAKEELGSLRWEMTTAGLKCYKYVQNKSGGALANGDAVVYDTTTAASAYYQVTTTTTADKNCAAGIGIGAISSDYYGWIQVHGYHDAAKIKGDTDATTAGAFIGTSTTAKKLGGASAAVFGGSVAIESVSTDATGKVFLRGLV